MKNQGDAAVIICGAEGEYAETLRQKDMIQTALWRDKGAPMK